MASAHERMERSGLLGGRLDEEARLEWPAWAQEHFSRCGSCRALAAADGMAALAGGPVAAPPPPPGGFAALLARSRRPAPDLARLLRPSGKAVPERYRDRLAQTLELVCEGGGMRAFDPTARHLLVVAVGADGRPRVLVERRSKAPGQAALVRWRDPGDKEVVAVAASAAFDSALLLLWMGDVGPEASRRLVEEAGSVGLRVAVRAVPQRIRPQRLRVTTRELPPVDEEIRALLREGKAAGVGDRQLEAVGHYRRALTMAIERGDVRGRVRASVGLAILLDDLGYRDDALRVLSGVVDAAELDREHAAMVSLAMAHRCRGAGLIDEAAGWIEEAEANSDPGEPLLVFARIGIAMEREEFATVLALAEHPRLGELHGAQRTLLAALRGVAAARSGDLANAASVLDGVAECGHREGDIWLALARWLAASGPEIAIRDERLVVAARRALAGRAEDVVTIWVSLVVATALPSMVAAGSLEAASRLGRLLFLAEADAGLEGSPFVGVLGGPDSTWIVGPGARQVREAPMGAEGLGALSADARAECHAAGTAAPAHRAIAALLGAPTGQVIVGSTRGLHDLPACFPNGGPRVRCVLPGIRHRMRVPVGLDIVSLADPFGDLPGAHAEVPRQACARWLRGAEARRAAVWELAGVGLLHLGLHGSRRNGMPELLFADGPLTPPEVEGLRLDSHPVVLLTGCATAAREELRGVEQSFAAGFLRAGASAVVCTRVPVPDREMAEFTARLVARWPFGDPLAAVADVCEEIEHDLPKQRIAQAIVVY